jgi:SRSO17 transposase|tara:strand:+ start:87 stop:1415 length:1329 start_codon:yes stop_codon:yes gene_type:complete
MTADQIRSLQPALIALLQRFRPFFKRQITFQYFLFYITGLMAELKRKSIEPIALASSVPVRTLQEFLAFFVWDDARISDALQRMVADEHGSAHAIGILDASGHPKSGDKSPGVQRQWCGRTGKVDNCVVGQHLLYTDNHETNPFCCVLASDLFLPRSWSDDRPRCRVAGIPDDLEHRPKWRIAIDQIEHAIGNGVRFEWVTFDEDYGQIPALWFELDRLGQWGIGEVRKNFLCWPTLPKYHSLQRPFAAKRVDNVCRHSPVFTRRNWRRFKIKNRTRGPLVVEAKAARVRLVDASNSDNNASHPTDRTYWLIETRDVQTAEVKYFISNAPRSTALLTMLRVAFARDHIERWFRTAKQEAGFGAFEVRTYTSLIRHWLCSRLGMYFLATQTKRLRGEKSADHDGAGGRCGEPAGQPDMESMLANDRCVGRTGRILSMAQLPLV